MRIKKQIVGILHNENISKGILYTIFSFFNSGISFILILILAKFLSPSDYGSLNLFNTFVTLLGIIISLSTTSFVGVCFFRKSRESLRSVIIIALGVTTLMFFVASIILNSFPDFIERIIGIPIKYIWFGVMICYFQVFNTLNLDIWRLEERPISYGIYGVSFALFNFLLTIWLVVGLKQNWEGRVYAWTILASIYFIISVVFLVKRHYLIFKIPSKQLIQETLIFALPLIPHTLSFWIKSGMDRYIINFFYNQTTVGFFSFASNFAAIVLIIGNAFNATNSVYIYKNLANGYEFVNAVLKKQTRMMTLIFAILSVLVGILGFCIVSVFIPQYSNSLQFIIPLCLGSFFQCIYLLWVNYLFFYKKTVYLMYITFTTALIQVILSIWLTRHSPIYTAWVSMVISLFTTLLVYYYSNKILNNEENVKDN